MTRVEFFLSDEIICGFCVKGHSGYDISGLDIVCAAVSSAVELTANGITEIAKAKAEVVVKVNEVRLHLLELTNEPALMMLKSLRLHLELLASDYPDNISLNDMEV